MTNAALQFTPRRDLDERAEDAAYAGALMRQHIQVGMNNVVNVARLRPKREREAMIWLASYARREHLTAEALTDQLGVDRKTIRAALTRPDADVAEILPRIESMRAILEANLRAPASTRVHRDVVECLEYALEQGAITEYLGPTRSGKTETGEWFYLKNLHQAAYVICKRGESYQAFIYSVAKALGISVSGRKHLGLIEDQIKSLFAKGGLRLLIVDEGHRLWPKNIADEPAKIEFLRTLWDEYKVGVAILATPQYALSMNLALAKSTRWAPGQWEGRAVRWMGYDRMKDADLQKVALHHYADAPSDVIEQLIQGAKEVQGLCGHMVNALTLARFKAKTNKPTLLQIKEAQAQMSRGSQIEELAKKGTAS